MATTSWLPALSDRFYSSEMDATRSLPHGAILTRNCPNIDRCQMHHHWSPLAILPSADGGGCVSCRRATACRPSLRDDGWQGVLG
jgi:hypothetical protein